MKRLLLKSTLLLCALVIGSMNVWADESTSTLTFTKKCDGSGTADDNVSWTVTSDGTESNFDSTKGIHYGTSSAQVTYIKLTTSEIDGTITKVVVNASTASDVSATASVTVGGNAFGGEAQSLSSNAADYTFTGSASGEIVVTVTKPSKATKAIYVKSVAVTYTTGESGGTPTVATPTISPSTGTYTTAQNVTISCGTEGATIHYTINGDEPTESDATYSSSISVTTNGTTLKAKAFKEGMDASSVATATYTIKPNTPTITAAGATVTITGDDGCTFYYTTDGTAPDNSSTKYSAPFEQSTDCTIKAIAYDTYGNPSGVKSYTFKFIPLSPKNVNSGYYVKVTDVSTLENGDAILIVNEDAKKALGAQSGNNCPAKDVTIADGTISNIGDAQKLVLVKKTEKISDEDTEVFYFYTGSGYLYAASSNNNYLKKEDVPDDDGNARATISIASGDATIVFTGTNTRNNLRYNGSGTSSLFSCYASTSNMALVQIYKEVPAEPSDPVVSGTTITLTTTANMDGWRAFYDGSKAYEVDANTTIYTVSEAAGSTVTLKAEAGKIIPVGSAVVVKTTDAGHSMTLTETATTATLGSNILQASDGKSAVDGYRLGYGAEDGIAFYKYTATAPAAGIVYIPATNLTTTAPALTIEFGETTGVSEVRSQKDDVSGEYFNLNGQRVIQPTKGLYIVNGRKVLVP